MSRLMSVQNRRKLNWQEIRHVALVLVGSCIATGLGTWAAWQWLIAFAGDVAAAWGLLLDVYGLIGTAVGFYIALRQIHNAQLASEAAERASEEAKSRFAAYDVVSELARAGSALKESQRHVSNGSWTDVMESISEARVSIVRLSALPSALDQDGREALVAMSARLEKAGRRIRSSLTKGTRMPDQTDVLHAMSEYQLEITKLAMKVESQL